MYRGLKLWEAAVTEAGSLDQDDVIAALDHAKIADGPGRPGRDGARPAPRADEHVHRPGDGGRFKVVEKLGVIDPKEAVHAVGVGPYGRRSDEEPRLSGRLLTAFG